MKQAVQQEFTGRHMLIIMVLFFGTIITVNLIMATLANTSWSGLVVRNSYVASQEFNEKAVAARAQAALGWTPVIRFGSGRITFQMQDKSGGQIVLEGVKLVLRHPVGEKADLHLTLERQPDGSFSAAEAIPDGVWTVETTALSREHPAHFTTRRVVLVEGKIQ